jgi:hypothetical protein
MQIKPISYKYAVITKEGLLNIGIIGKLDARKGNDQMHMKSSPLRKKLVMATALACCSKDHYEKFS